jgi:hypothetical protein
MKSVLGCLMCLVLSISQGFADDPFQPSPVDVVGTYAGVFVPIIVIVNPGPPPVTLPRDNSLALFTLSIPSTGLASGTATIFRNGLLYTATIQGSADPNSGKLTGIIDGMATGASGSGAQFSAAGRFQSAEILANPTSSASPARVKGKAKIAYTASPEDPRGDSGGPILYKVRGFKQ